VDEAPGSSARAFRGVVDQNAFKAAYPDLDLLEPLQVSRRRGVYRATSIRHGSCVVKTSTEFDSLRNEYHRLLLCRGCENIVKVIELYEKTDCLYIALLTQNAGQSLEEWLQKQPGGRAGSLETVLRIGIQISAALDHLHRNARLIHSDLNPTNVCYDESRDRVTLIDLGSAHGFLEPFKTVTPAFQSPEQARGIIDYRSDLYSLGVLLFNIYTGTLPISMTSYSSYRQAVMLEPPHTVSRYRKDCHPMMEKIVARLLVKNADERYTTAAGLRFDLERLLEMIKHEDANVDEVAKNESFELGTREVPFNLTLSNALIGRTEDLSVLEELYDACSNDCRGGFCYIEGKPGVGKSTLVHSFASQRRNPFFVFFKFNQFVGRPMNAVIEVRIGGDCLTSTIWFCHSPSFFSVILLDHESAC